MYPTSVEGHRLALREFTPDDADALHRIYGDPLATRHLSFEPRSSEQVAALVAGIVDRARQTPRQEYALAAVLRETGELVGMARLALGEHSSGQIGFALRADQWGHGLGIELVELLFRLGFDKLGLHRIWGARAPDNIASASVMTRAGMVEEGRIRHHVHVRGAWRDSITHSILENEW